MFSKLKLITACLVVLVSILSYLDPVYGLRCHDCTQIDETGFSCLQSDTNYGECPSKQDKRTMCITLIPVDKRDIRHFRRGCYFIDAKADFHNIPECWKHTAESTAIVTGVVDVDARICICDGDRCNNVEYSGHWHGLKTDQNKEVRQAVKDGRLKGYDPAENSNITIHQNFSKIVLIFTTIFLYIFL